MTRLGITFDAFLDGFSFAGLFTRLRRPGAPDMLIGKPRMSYQVPGVLDRARFVQDTLRYAREAQVAMEGMAPARVADWSGHLDERGSDHGRHEHHSVYRH